MGKVERTAATKPFPIPALFFKGEEMEMHYDRIVRQLRAHAENFENMVEEGVFHACSAQELRDFRIHFLCGALRDILELAELREKLHRKYNPSAPQGLGLTFNSTPL